MYIKTVFLHFLCASVLCHLFHIICYDIVFPSLLPILLPPVCYRVIEMPYAYQCCVYGSCDSYKPASQWDTEQSNTDEDLHKRTVAMYPIHTDTHCKQTHTVSVQAYIYRIKHRTCARWKFESHMSALTAELLTQAGLKHVRALLKPQLPGS